jgi:hypothetical protein
MQHCPAGTYTCVEDLPEDDWRRSTPRFQKEAFDKVNNVGVSNACISAAFGVLQWMHCSNRLMMNCEVSNNAA